MDLRRTARLIAAIVTVATALPALGAVAAINPQPINPQLKVAPAVARPGQTVTFSGSRFSVRATVRLLIGPPRSEADPFATARTDARGNFTTRVRLARAAEPGLYVVLACQRSCRIKATTRLRIRSS